jgi:hypothetical protein
MPRRPKSSREPQENDIPITGEELVALGDDAVNNELVRRHAWQQQRFDFGHELIERDIIEADIGDGGEQTFHHQLGVSSGDFLPLVGEGEINQGKGQVILQIGCVGTFAAGTGNGAAFAADGLFALETEHV